jgi:SAM-dependent methyltransferase
MIDAARAAYDTLAPSYDEFTSANNYELWLGEILLSELRRHGLRQGSALDVGCGTGRAFGPLLSRGWEVVGCDISPAMLAQAREKFGDTVPLATADMRDLPVFGVFDLVLVMNDAVNYLTEDGDLERALAGIAANLAATGLLLFDVNTLGGFEGMYGKRGEAGDAFERTLVAAGVEPQLHRQRHFTPEHLAAAMASAGLVSLAMLGQREERGAILLEPALDEERDTKIVCIAGRARPKLEVVSSPGQAVGKRVIHGYARFPSGKPLERRRNR